MLFEETGNTVTLCLSGSPTAFGATFSNSSRDEGGVWLLGFCDLTRMTQATNNTPATANDRGKYLWVRITGFRRSKSSRRTVELTRRRQFIQPSPGQLSCETRYRRSGPTICYVS